MGLPGLHSWCHRREEILRGYSWLLLAGQESSRLLETGLPGPRRSLCLGLFLGLLGYLESLQSVGRQASISMYLNGSSWIAPLSLASLISKCRGGNCGLNEKEEPPSGKETPLLGTLYSLILFNRPVAQSSAAGAGTIEELSESWSSARLEVRECQHGRVCSAPLLGKRQGLCRHAFLSDFLLPSH